MRVKFTVDGPPKGKGRPRFRVASSKTGNFVAVSTPPDTVQYENLVKIEYVYQCNRYYFGDAELGIKVTAYYPISKSVSKKKREDMIAGKINPTKKPDCDNVLKIVADSLNQLAYKDDAQIIESTVIKRYAEVPHTDIEIYNFGDAEQ